MLATLVRPLRFATLAVWLAVLAVYGLGPTPITVGHADEGWCHEQGCKDCDPCKFCASQPPNPPGGSCWTEKPPIEQ